MVVKQLLFDEDGREKLKNGIRTISKAVGSTLGPMGNTVLMESEHHTQGITVTKDGVTVAKGINLIDPVEDLAVQLVRQAADRTAKKAGDGTTTSVVLTEAIINAAEAHMSPESNTTEVIRHIHSIAKRIDSSLVKMSKKVSGKMLLNVATISSNNDPILGATIADVYKQVNHVTVENSRTTKTHTDIVKGIKVDRGFSSKWFINDVKKEECVMLNPYIFVTNQEIVNLENISAILKPIVEGKHPLLIIGQLNIHTLATIVKNKNEGRIDAANIIPPSMGYRQDDLMTDISIATGAKFFSSTSGDNIANVQLSDLGRAAKVIIDRDKTIIIPMSDGNEELDDHIKNLRESISNKVDADDVSFVNERISNISGGVGVIHIGANSDIEQKELKDRADDAVLAVKAALEDGILSGGGISLINSCRGLVDSIKGASSDYITAVDIVLSALEAPFKLILSNAGRDYTEVGKNIAANGGLNYGYNVKTDQYGDMIKMGVIDPTKVTRTALENAVSVATTIMSTNAIITNVRDYDSSK